MDLMLNLPNSSGYSESDDETLGIADEVLQKLITDVENLLKNTECKSEFSSEECKNEFSSEESNLSVKMNQTNCDSLGKLMRSSECKSGSNLLQPDLDAHERKTSYEDSQVSFPRSAECSSDSNSGQLDVGACDGQINLEDPPNQDSSNEDFEDSLDGSNSDRGNDECSSTDDTLRSANILSDRRTENRFENAQLSAESSDNDDEELFDEVGDEEAEADLDDASFLQRVIQYIRETDMLLIANQGGGDVFFDLDDDFDDENADDSDDD